MASLNSGFETRVNAAGFPVVIRNGEKWVAPSATVAATGVAGELRSMEVCLIFKCLIFKIVSLHVQNVFQILKICFSWRAQIEFRHSYSLLYK